MTLEKLCLRAEQIYTVDELAEALSFNRRKIRDLVTEGEITARKIGGQWRIMGEDALTWFASLPTNQDRTNSNNTEDGGSPNGQNKDVPANTSWSL